MKTEHLDFLAAVRLLVKKGGYIRRAGWDNKYRIALDVNMTLLCGYAQRGGFWGMLTAENILASDWEHVCE